MDETKETKEVKAKKKSPKKAAVKAKPKVTRRNTEKSDREKELIEYEREVLWHIRKYINNHHEFLEVTDFDGGLLIAKTIELSVNIENNRPTFQPYSKTEKKKYCTVSIIEYSEYAQRPAFIHELFKSGCPILEIFSDRMVKEVLEAI
jgi:hypothetical protein